VADVASVLVDGVRVPLAVGGHPALDFCNTRAGWGSGSPKEYLHGVRELAVWAREVDLVTPAQAARAARAAVADPAGGAAVVARALAFRTDLYAVLTRPPAHAAFERVAEAARLAAASSVLRRGLDGIAEWRLPAETDPMELPYLAVVRAATDLLTEPAATTVSACPMPDCGWLFANPTGRRRWCSMAWCGNRSKARRFAARVRDA
jgi:predicted RNA-binding Zn ribbon-like protein